MKKTVKFSVASFIAAMLVLLSACDMRVSITPIRVRGDKLSEAEIASFKEELDGKSSAV